MAAQYFILPINPGAWEHSMSTLQIDPQTLATALHHQWPEIQFLSTQNFALKWTFHHLGFPGASYYTLHKNNQFVSFYSDMYFRQFILWFRQFIPEIYPLYFLTSAHSEDDFLALTADTSEADIDNYLQNPKTS